MVRQASVATMCFALCVCVTTFVFGPAPAQAIPIGGDYVFTSGLEGTFTSDGTQLTAWNFSHPTVPIQWQNGAVDQIVLQNHPNLFSTVISGIEGVNLNWRASFYTGSGIAGGPNIIDGPFTFASQPSPVPVPATGLLLAMGLLALAGIRWWAGRQGRIPNYLVS